ncbi:unnamed protein product [Rhizophagus irregularis]|uniref:Uncharacterized protein n=1 Tax=Rhizophagus irregularis TaxID=588596 RepID=A0A916E246_9GLOM|nr:unnamed protein product [Rhizophagus irregularis]
MPIEWIRAATDHLIRQRRILLSGEMEEVEVAGSEQASVTISLSEADSGSSPQKRGIVGDANVTGSTYGDFELEI